MPRKRKAAHVNHWPLISSVHLVGKRDGEVVVQVHVPIPEQSHGSHFKLPQLAPVGSIGRNVDKANRQVVGIQRPSQDTGSGFLVVAADCVECYPI